MTETEIGEREGDAMLLVLKMEQGPLAEKHGHHYKLEKVREQRDSPLEPPEGMQSKTHSGPVTS